MKKVLIIIILLLMVSACVNTTGQPYDVRQKAADSNSEVQIEVIEKKQNENIQWVKITEAGWLAHEYCDSHDITVIEHRTEAKGNRGDTIHSGCDLEAQQDNPVKVSLYITVRKIGDSTEDIIIARNLTLPLDDNDEAVDYWNSVPVNHENKKWCPREQNGNGSFGWPKISKCKPRKPG